MVKASITLDGIAGLKANDVRAAARKALAAVGGRWILKYLPLHFKQSAHARYGYLPRDKGYRLRKRLGGDIAGVESIREDKPLVWSGRSREHARQARVVTKAASSTYAYADVIINAPALNFRYQNSKIDMRDEVTRITQSELQDLADLFVREFDRELERMGKAKRRTRNLAA